MSPLVASLAKCDDVVGVQPSVSVLADWNNVMALNRCNDSAIVQAILAQWPLLADILAHAFPCAVVSVFICGLFICAFITLTTSTIDHAIALCTESHCIMRPYLLLP